MEKLLTAYLYEYKNCPLPSVGSLVLQPGHAKYLPGENKILAPVPFIELSDTENSSDSLLQFLAYKKNISIPEANLKLHSFCSQLKELKANEEFPFSSAGSFFMDENEQLQFKSLALSPSFFPETKAERVIHPDVAHQILVGDKETNSTAMTELLNDDSVAKSRWWIAAVIMAVLGLVTIFVYYSQNAAGDTGNAMPVEPTTAPKTYSTTE